jgi:broad specificity phosphatase PhoE
MNRIKIPTALALTLLTAWVFTPSEPRAEGEVTSVILVRHAEKEPTPGDPPLSERGRKRARELARVLADAGVDALSATQFGQTQQTLEPLSEQLGLEIEIAPVDLDDTGGYARGLAGEILEKHRGRTILLAGHSNTVPLLLEAFGIDDPPSLSENDYDDLFLLHIGLTEQPRMIHLHYGDPSP